MKKTLWLALAAIIMIGCTKKEEPVAQKEPETEVVPMSAEPADPSSASESTSTTQDPVVLEPIEGEPAKGADNGEEIIESVDDDAPPAK